MLNLPEEITFASGAKIAYLYTADGTKRQKKVNVNGKTTVTDYLSGYIYKDGQFKQFATAEGHIEERDGKPLYVYDLQDIWNNVRLSFTDFNDDGAPEILQERNYYPFGLEHKGYNEGEEKNNYHTFQDQELTEDLGLKVHEFKYRFHDPALGRFWQEDPLAEKYAYNSPYAFQENKLGLGIELEGKEMTLFDVRQTHRDEDLLKGRITQAEYLEGMQAESMGALLGLGLLADIYTRGLLSKGLMFTGLVRSGDLTEQAHDLKKLGDKKGAEAKLNAAGEASKIAIYGFASELAGAGISKAVRSVGRGVGEDIQGGLNLFKWGESTTTSAKGWKTGDYMLYLPNKGTPKLNWKANYGALRREMGLSRPIFDTYLKSNGALRITDGFLKTERYILQSRGWTFNRELGAWVPSGF